MEKLLSKHAEKRLKERSSKSLRQNKLALERGKSHENFVGSFRRYLDKIRLKKPFYTDLIVYSNCIFLYDEHKNLITVLSVPSKYHKYLRRKE